MKSLFPKRSLAAYVLVVTAVCSAPAQIHAQSDSDLRRLNQQLTTQVADLQKELEAVRQQNEVLQARLRQVEQQLASAKRNPAATTAQPVTLPEQPEKVTIDETVPTNSPRALFNAVRTGYEKATADLEMGKTGDGKRRTYMKKLESWAAAANREFRGQIAWHVRVEDFRIDRAGNRIATLRAVDPETDVPLGNSFEATLSKTQIERLGWYEVHDQLGVMVLRGILLPEVRISEERVTRGSFDNPPFIGPYAEFMFDVEVQSLRPVKEDEKEQSSPTPSSATRPVPVK